MISDSTVKASPSASGSAWQLNELAAGNLSGDSNALRAFIRSHRLDWAWLPILGVALLDALLAPRLGLKFVGWGSFALKLAVPAGVAGYYRFSGRNERLAQMGYYVTLWLIFSVSGCILTYVAARVDLPLRDIQFAHYDRLLSFDWYRWTNFVESHKKLKLILGLAYSSILPQTLGSVLYFAHVRQLDRNDDLLRTTIIAALIAALISSLFPALGPHLNGEYVEWSATLAAIRDRTISTFSIKNLQGIVSFPSFHTIAAILLIYAHRPPLRSFSLVLMLNLIMLISIPSAGQHYLVDVLSGGIVAGISIESVRRLRYLEAPASRRSRGAPN